VTVAAVGVAIGGMGEAAGAAVVGVAAEEKAEMGMEVVVVLEIKVMVAMEAVVVVATQGLEEMAMRLAIEEKVDAAAAALAEYKEDTTAVAGKAAGAKQRKCSF